LNVQAVEERDMPSLKEQPCEQRSEPDADAPFFVFQGSTWPAEVDARQGWKMRHVALE
jgi:hypothetical protein